MLFIPTWTITVYLYDCFPVLQRLKTFRDTQIISGKISVFIRSRDQNVENCISASSTGSASPKYKCTGNPWSHNNHGIVGSTL